MTISPKMLIKCALQDNDFIRTALARQIPRILVFCVLIMATTIPGLSEDTLAPTATFPVKRTLTSSDGRALEVTLVNKTEKGVVVSRAGDGKEFEISFEKLSTEDQAFIAGIPVKAAIGKRVLLIYDPGRAISPENKLTEAGYQTTIYNNEKLNELVKKNGLNFLDDYDIVWNIGFHDSQNVKPAIYKAAHEKGMPLVLVTPYKKATTNELLTMQKPENNMTSHYAQIDEKIITYNTLEFSKKGSTHNPEWVDKAVGYLRMVTVVK